MIGARLQQPVTEGRIDSAWPGQKKRAAARLGGRAACALPGTSVHFAHLGLQVVLQAHLADEVDLRFEKVDVLLGVVEDLLQQIP